ncbi:MAG: M42 family metallopeptidase [Candidatus Heteroscillospira sp.]|jgi:putative aminopeptidase FrvX
MLDTVKTLCYLSGVSGYEDEVRDYILERALPCADEIMTDPMGNLIVMKKGAVTPDKKVMLCAHMDEVGIIITGLDDDGYLRFDFVGGVDRRVVLGKAVYIGEDRVPGVIGVKAYHLVSRDEEKSVPKTQELYIDIGARSREEAEKLVSLGDFGVFDDTVVEFGSGFLKAKAIDDRLGCAVMLKLLESELPCDCSFAFTVQEEVGTRGAKTAAWSVEPDVCLVLEGTTAADIPGSTEANEVCRLDGGVVIPFMDRGAIYDPGLYKTLTAAADELGIKWQTKRMIAGGTDASAIQRSRGGVRTAGLACALRNLHSPACVANTADFEPMLRLAEKFLEIIAEEKKDI